MDSACVGQPAPHFDLPTIEPSLDAAHARVDGYQGRWLVLLFYPRDFSFVCPTELVAFSNRLEDFSERKCDVLAISVDGLDTHRKWMQASAIDGGVSGLRFAVASDVDGEVCRRFGVLDSTGVALRGLFIIDPAGVVQYSVVHNLNVGRNTDEILRVLDALREGGLCAAGWTRADGTIDPRLDLAEGRVFGNCRIESLLGEGGFGWVYAAWDLKLDRRVAVKVGRTTARSTREAVLHEARTVAQLAHPNICPVYSVEETAGVPIIVMEHLAGGSLAERLKRGQLPEEDVARIAVEVASALAASHAADVVHGDIKPANILFAADGTAKVADFGMARSPSLPTQPENAIGGTPSYMAPEQTRGVSPSTASDVFSTALVIIEMLTGERALRGDVGEIWELIRNFDPGLLVDRVPERYRDIWTRMMARESDERPTMAEVAQSWASRGTPAT